jgi:hypothetical protein
MPVAGIRPGIAGEGHCHSILTPHLEGKGCPNRQRDPRSYHSQSPQATRLKGRDVHGAATPFTITGLLTQNLRHHAVGPRAFGDVVSVAAVRTGDQVVLAQGHADAHARGFLPDVGVYRALHLAAFEKVNRGQFKLPDTNHPAIHFQQCILAYFHCITSSRLGMIWQTCFGPFTQSTNIFAWGYARIFLTWSATASPSF